MTRFGGTEGCGPVVVTGGAGFVGSIVVRLLLARNRPVRVVDAMLFGDDALRDLRFDPNLDIVEADFRDRDVMRDSLAGAAAVIHLGAIVGDPACTIDEHLTISTNVEATRTIAGLARDLGVPRLIFASTCSVYGASHQPLDETSSLNPVSLYANSKIAAEQILLEHATEAFAPTILRFGTAFGASPRLRFDLVVNLLTAKAVCDGQITIHGGNQWRPFIHVADIAGAVMLALDAPRQVVAGQIINVGVDELNYQIRHLGAIIQRHVPQADVVTSDEVTDKRNYFVQFQKARDLLGFTHTRTVEDGVRELVALLSDGRVDSYRTSSFHNVIALSEAFAEQARLDALPPVHHAI